ncbi:MAG TPA: type II secretion system F family protein [Acidimicrobiia bacterium]|nr:type II secretion system F family protein [Acidimicrobiia bacterium]
MTAALLGAAWAALLAAPFARRARRAAVASRTIALRTPGRPTATRAKLLPGVRAFDGLGRRLRGSVVGRVVTGVRGALVRRRAEAAVQRDLPVVLDLLGVAVGAGCTPYLAVETTVAWAPPDLAARFERVPRACRLGASFPDALGDLARTTPLLAPLVEALLTSERLGAPVGPALARLADEERATSRRRAEAHARRVPVRLLFPLVFLVLPAFGLLTVVPALLSGLART